MDPGEIDLPSWEDASERVDDGSGSPLDHFIAENEPVGQQDEGAFRTGLTSLVRWLFQETEEDAEDLHQRLTDG